MFPCEKGKTFPLSLTKLIEMVYYIIMDKNHTILEQILSSHKPLVRDKFKTLRTSKVPHIDVLPTDAQEAFEQGYRLGLQSGFLEGLVAGVDIGTDVMYFGSVTSPSHHLN